MRIRECGVMNRDRGEEGMAGIKQDLCSLIPYRGDTWHYLRTECRFVAFTSHSHLISRTIH